MSFLYSHFLSGDPADTSVHIRHSAEASIKTLGSEPRIEGSARVCVHVCVFGDHYGERSKYDLTETVYTPPKRNHTALNCKSKEQGAGRSRVWYLL